MNNRKTAVLVIAIAHCLVARAKAEEHAPVNLISNARQVTFEGRRSGEGYFSSDGSKMIFQSERDPKNPFYQIFVLDLNSGETTRVSNGSGKTTCAWLHPDGKRALFASTHEDPKTSELQRAALDRRATGKTKRYEWDYDEHFEIYTTKIGSGQYTNLTKARGYDAEGSYSPDGKWVAFSSNRHAYSTTLSSEDAQLLKNDAKYFLEIYIMRADGTGLKRLTTEPGYDGGPFFSPDGKRICWRRFTPDGNVAEIWTMNIDGSDQKQITKLEGMSWAPFYHPSGEYLIFTTDIHGRGNFELYIVDVEGKRDPVRVTNLPAFDGLPVFFPDGRRLAWTANRTVNKKGQIYFANFDDAAARNLLSSAPARTSTASTTDSEDHVATFAQTTKDDRENLRDRVLKILEGNNGYGWNTINSGQPEHIGIETELDGTEGLVIELSLRSTKESTGQLLYMLYEFKNLNSKYDSKRFGRELDRLIEIGEYLAIESMEGHGPPSRGIVLHVLFDLKESKKHELFDLAWKAFGKETTAAIEIRGLDGAGEHYLIDGVATSPRWSRSIERLNVLIGLPIRINQAPKPESLAMFLHEKKVPAISISPSGRKSGGSSGNANEIDLRATRLTARLIEALLLNPNAPEFTPITKRADAVKGRPYLGTEPDYRAQVEGVLLKGVKENGPAHVGGLRGGDIIVEIDNKPIADVHAYAAALDELEAGAHILIAVSRDGERVLLRVTVGERDG